MSSTPIPPGLTPIINNLTHLIETNNYLKKELPGRWVYIGEAFEKEMQKLEDEMYRGGNNVRSFYIAHVYYGLHLKNTSKGLVLFHIRGTPKIYPEDEALPSGSYRYMQDPCMVLPGGRGEGVDVGVLELAAGSKFEMGPCDGTGRLTRAEALDAMLFGK